MDYQSEARRARLRLAGIGIAVLAVVAGGVVTLVGFGDDDRPPAAADAKPTPSTTASTSARPSPAKEFTPATAARVPLLKPKTNTEGIGRGFEHSSLGATSAAVTYWQDLSLLDDSIARRQWAAIASKDSPGTVDRGVSEVRKVRESAGLPPSGGNPDGITFSTSVKAVLTRSMDKSGDVIDVWMVYDRYAVIRDKGGDESPLKDEVTHLILKWEAGDWKVTEEAKYTSGKPFGPRAYDPDSKYAFSDGWRMVDHG
ncbi:hypothetical protein [Streptomyces sp. NPDC051211]|uniref:hypothetical protein n=1 Tax=Streptomyces sp. NPDC051211 TaxID=3154643 RepID=UPI00344BF794